MSDESLGDYYRDVRDIMKEKKAGRRNKYEPMLTEIGAKKANSYIWIYNEWHIYPGKATAMNIHTNKKIPIEMFFKIVRKGKQHG